MDRETLDRAPTPARLREMIAEVESFYASAIENAGPDDVRLWAERLAAFRFALANLETRQWLTDLQRNHAMPFSNADIMDRLRGDQ